jgi:hypothetical protein
MTKGKYNQAYKVFKRIAVSNKRSFESLNELDIMKKRNENEINTDNYQENLVETSDQHQEKTVHSKQFSNF